MNKETEIRLTKELNAELIAIMESKGADYAGADMLSNFKNVSTAIRVLDIDPTTPEGDALGMVVRKLSRIGNLIKKGVSPENESIMDSFKDGINYFILAYLAFTEKQEDASQGITEPVADLQSAGL